MKNLLIAVFAITVYQTASAQFVARVQMKEPLEGICDNDNVYVMFPGMTGQVAAECSLTDDEIEKMLNEIPFLKDNPKYKCDAMIGFYVNCEGELLGCKMDNKTGNEELDAQIEAVFNKLIDWKAGTLNGKKVDTHVLYSFVVKKGKIKLN
jgi:hypothetical protein